MTLDAVLKVAVLVVAILGIIWLSVQLFVVMDITLQVIKTLDNPSCDDVVSRVLDTEQLTEQRRRVLDLYNQGLSAREMANRLGISTQRVHQQIKKLELPPPGTGRKQTSP